MKAMLTQQRTTEPIADVVESIVRQSMLGAERGFAALFDSKGRPRVSHLGVAFGTKLVHFAGYDKGVRPRPLIYDIRVWRATKDLPGAPVLP